MVKKVLMIGLLILLVLTVGCSGISSEDGPKVTLPMKDTETELVDESEADESQSSESEVDIATEDTENIPDTDFETEEANMQEADETLPLLGLKICLDPGHGNFEKGYNEAIGPGSSQTKPAFVSGTSGQYQTEAEFNLKLCNLLKPLLEEKGAVVYMTRTDENATLSNIGRAEFANDLGCDMVVRIHADGSDNSGVSGISMLVPGANEYLYDEEIINASYNCGAVVLASVIESTSANDRGVIVRNDLTGFNWTKVPCILLECGFMSNPDEDRLLNDEIYQMKLATGILNGLIEYYMTV